jgi:hypothetical protein
VASVADIEDDDKPADRVDGSTALVVEVEVEMEGVVVVSERVVASAVVLVLF